MAKADKLLTVDQVAKLLALSSSTIYEGGCRAAELLTINLGEEGKPRVLRYSYLDVQEWIARRVQEARTERERQRRQVRPQKQKTLPLRVIRTEQ